MAVDTQPVLASSAQATAESLIIDVSGVRHRIPWAQCSELLAQATDDQRRHLELSPSGYGIHWPLLDEDLAVGPLVEKALDH